MAFPSSHGHAVELSAEDARELARLLSLLLNQEFSPNAYAASDQDRSPVPRGRAGLVAKASALLSERRRRSAHLNPVMFGEPAWDMLLVLYINDFTGKEQSIGKLVASIGAPHTTALRWIDYLEKERLISRETHPRDRRTVILAITEKGRQKLDDYLQRLAI